MPKPIHFVSLLILLGLFSPVHPVYSQALVPYVPQIDEEQLEQQGLVLAQEAAQLAQFQQYELALPKAELAAQLAPNNSAVWLLLGRLYLQAEELDQTLAAFQQAEAIEPDNPAVLFDLGSIYFRLEEYQKSVEYLEAGLESSPNVPGAYFDLGNAYYKLSSYEEAIAAYEAAVDLEEEFWPAVNNIGLVLYEMGDVEGALQHWRDALDISSGEAEPQLAIAIALYSRGDRAEGIELGTVALQTDNRYADVTFLRENLWGDRLLSEAEAFLSLPQIRETVAQLSSGQSDSQTIAPE